VILPVFHRILIVKLSALGDVAHALPAIDYLARAAPGARIDWAVDRRFSGLLEGNPRLHRVVPLDLKRWKSEWSTTSARREASDAVRRLREGGYDVAFDIQGNSKSGVVTRLSGAPLRYGFDRNGTREAPNLLFTNRKVALRAADRHISQKILRIVSAPFGGEFDLSDLKSGLFISKQQERRAERIVSEIFPSASPLVVLHAGTTWRTKRMDPSFWSDALRLLKGRFPDMGVLLSWGSEEERREAEAIRGSAGRMIELLPRLALWELAAVYRECAHMIAPDTGPLHVAAAAGARTVSVFRVTEIGRAHV
jgi:heptosyltransferase-1